MRRILRRHVNTVEPIRPANALERAQQKRDLTALLQRHRLATEGGPVDLAMLDALGERDAQLRVSG